MNAYHIASLACVALWLLMAYRAVSYFSAQEMTGENLVFSFMAGLALMVMAGAAAAFWESGSD